MTVQEFSNEFDILYNNIASNQAPGLDEYEKSVFLTKAQDSIILDIVGGMNPLGSSFEKTEEIRRYIDKLTCSKVLELGTSTPSHLFNGLVYKYAKPEDLFCITNERVTFNNTKEPIVEVVPTTQDELTRVLKNPFKKPSFKRVLRLDIDDSLEILTQEELKDYFIMYVRDPKPIILANLEGGLSIKGETTQMPCELNPILHNSILVKAVQLAQISMGLIQQSN